MRKKRPFLFFGVLRRHSKTKQEKPRDGTVITTDQAARPTATATAYTPTSAFKLLAVVVVGLTRRRLRFQAVSGSGGWS